RWQSPSCGTASARSSMKQVQTQAWRWASRNERRMYSIIALSHATERRRMTLPVQQILRKLCDLACVGGRCQAATLTPVGPRAPTGGQGRGDLQRRVQRGMLNHQSPGVQSNAVGKFFAAAVFQIADDRVAVMLHL